MNWMRRLKYAGRLMRHGSIPLDVVSVTSYSQTPGFQDARIPSRRTAEGYVSFSRCVHLISTAAAHLVANTARVIDDQGRVVTTPRMRAALRLIKESPDGIHTGFEFFRDVLGDYLIAGNALVHVTKRDDRPYMTPVRLDRLGSSTASTMIGDRTKGLDSLVYRATRFGMDQQETFSIRSVAHAKYFPRDAAHSLSNDRSFFSPVPIEMLARSLSIGKRGDAWVDSFFDEASRNDLAIIFPDEAQGSDAEERTIEAYETAQTDKRSPLYVHGGAAVQNLNPTPQNANALELRRYSVEDVSRFFGVPVPLINLHQSQWGSGIEQLARLFYRYCVRLHLDIVLDALSFKMLPDGHRFEIDPNQEVKGDMTAMTAFVSAMRPSTNTPGVMGQQELRDHIGIRGAYPDDWNFDPGAARRDTMGEGDEGGER